MLTLKSQSSPSPFVGRVRERAVGADIGALDPHLTSPWQGEGFVR